MYSIKDKHRQLVDHLLIQPDFNQGGNSSCLLMHTSLRLLSRIATR